MRVCEVVVRFRLFSFCESLLCGSSEEIKGRRNKRKRGIALMSAGWCEVNTKERKQGERGMLKSHSMQFVAGNNTNNVYVLISHTQLENEKK